MVEVTAIVETRSAAGTLRRIDSAISAVLLLVVVITTLAIAVTGLAVRIGLSDEAVIAVATVVMLAPAVIALIAMGPWRVIREEPPLTRTIGTPPRRSAGYSDLAPSDSWSLGELAAGPTATGTGARSSLGSFMTDPASASLSATRTIMGSRTGACASACDAVP